jgi:hypothetical protein
VIADIGVHGREFLQRFHSSKSEHCALASAESEVAIFTAIVQPLAQLTTIDIAQVAHRGRIRAKPVGNDGFGLAVTLQRFLHEASTHVQTLHRSSDSAVPNDRCILSDNALLALRGLFYGLHTCIDFPGCSSENRL